MAFLQREASGLLVIDVQEKLFPHIDRSDAILLAMKKAIRGFQIFQRPIFASEQYPQGLGRTIPALQELLGAEQNYRDKISFSCCGDEVFRQRLDTLGVRDWVIVGLEAHICVLQTAKDLFDLGFGVTVLQDAIGSRSSQESAIAVEEMRAEGIRISSVETVLFELLRHSQAAEFKEISQLVKS